MTLLDRIRQWLSGLFGGEQSQTDSEGEDDTGVEDGLDPDNVTEVRAEATDDSVARLAELQRRDSDGEEEEEQR